MHRFSSPAFLLALLNSQLSESLPAPQADPAPCPTIVNLPEATLTISPGPSNAVVNGFPDGATSTIEANGPAITIGPNLLSLNADNNVNLNGFVFMFSDNFCPAFVIPITTLPTGSESTDLVPLPGPTDTPGNPDEPPTDPEPEPVPDPIDPENPDTPVEPPSDPPEEPPEEPPSEDPSPPIVPIPIPSPVEPIPVPDPNPVDPIPDPVDPVPDPVDPVPEPVDPVPEPVDPIPVPDPIDPIPIPIPGPVNPIPIPIPDPVDPVPDPVDPVPEPVDPVPEPVDPVPEPVDPVDPTITPPPSPPPPNNEDPEECETQTANVCTQGCSFGTNALGVTTTTSCKDPTCTATTACSVSDTTSTTTIEEPACTLNGVASGYPFPVDGNGPLPRADAPTTGPAPADPQPTPSEPEAPPSEPETPPSEPEEPPSEPETPPSEPEVPPAEPSPPEDVQPTNLIFEAGKLTAGDGTESIVIYSYPRDSFLSLCRDTPFYKESTLVGLSKRFDIPGSNYKNCDFVGIGSEPLGIYCEGQERLPCVLLEGSRIDSCLAGNNDSFSATWTCNE